MGPLKSFSFNLSLEKGKEKAISKKKRKMEKEKGFKLVVCLRYFIAPKTKSRHGAKSGKAKKKGKKRVK